jgi:ABC-type transporter Mla MlaB component
MLKITLEPDVDETRLKLEGDLAGTWVAELEEYWRKTSPPLSGRPVCIDLTGVGRVDEAGRYLLALIHDSGARMVSAGVEMKDLLDSIARDWPTRRIEGPGWVASPVIPVRRR